MPLILPTKSRKMHLQEYAFSTFHRGEGMPLDPLRYSVPKAARVGPRPKYPRIIAIFWPTKNFSYIPGMLSREKKYIYALIKPGIWNPESQALNQKECLCLEGTITLFPHGENYTC